MGEFYPPPPPFNWAPFFLFFLSLKYWNNIWFFDFFKYFHLPFQNPGSAPVVATQFRSCDDHFWWLQLLCSYIFPCTQFECDKLHSCNDPNESSHDRNWVATRIQNLSRRLLANSSSVSAPRFAKTKACPRHWFQNWGPQQKRAKKVPSNVKMANRRNVYLGLNLAGRASHQYFFSLRLPFLVHTSYCTAAKTQSCTLFITTDLLLALLHGSSLLTLFKFFLIRGFGVK